MSFCEILQTKVTETSEGFRLSCSPAGAAPVLYSAVVFVGKAQLFRFSEESNTDSELN